MDKLKEKKILIIEDEAAICRLCDRVLTGEGYEVEVTNNAEYAQELVEDNEYNLVFSDIRLPIMNGMEFFQWLQTNHPGMINRVAFMTGSVIGGKTIQFLTESGRPHLYKPFGPDELKVFIAEVFEQEE